MDELVLYVTAGDPADKHASESLAAVASVQKSHHYTTFRNAECPVNGAAITGFGAGERLFVAGKNKALITSYAWGKETLEQRFPVPEQISCLALAHHPAPETASDAEKAPYRVPWLLAAGSCSGKLYVWELASGDLVCVKDAHYQEISTMEFSKCGTFLATGGLDTRVNVWRTLDLVTAEASPTCKPHVSFSDHALAVTGVKFVSSPSMHDCRVISGSRDGTVRIYDIVTKSLITTFVFAVGVECFARDPAGRALYVGLADGTVRQVAMYVINPYSHVLEAVGGNGKIVTVGHDPNMEASFLHHQNGSCVPTVMAVSMDGMCLVSGDSQGRTFVADVVTKQVVKSYTACKSAIAYLHLGVCSQAQISSGTVFDKKHRLLPPLKRVLVSGNLAEHTLTMQLSGSREQSVEFGNWLETKAQEEFEFKKNGGECADGGAELEVARANLDKVSVAYTALKEMYDDLLQAHETRE